MKAKALKAFLHDQLGRVEKGQVFEANAAQLAPVARFVEVIDEPAPKPKGKAKKHDPDA